MLTARELDRVEWLRKATAELTSHRSGLHYGLPAAIGFGESTGVCHETLGWDAASCDGKGRYDTADTLFPESSPVSCLSVCGAIPLSVLSGVCAQFELVVSASESESQRHLFLADRVEGEHKRQAVVLFVAGLILATRSPNAAFVLHEIRRLHGWLAAAVGRDASEYTPDGQLRAIGWQPLQFRLAAPSWWHLQQAGFVFLGVPAVSETVIDLSGDELQAVLEELLAEVNGFTSPIPVGGGWTTTPGFSSLTGRCLC